MLSTETGYSRDYSRSPYAGYDQSRELYFAVNKQDKRFHPKESVLGVEIEGHFKAYPFIELEKTTGRIQDRLGKRAILVKYDSQHRTAAVFDTKAELLPSVTAFWFAWYAFHPDTEVFTAANNRRINEYQNKENKIPD